MRWFEHSPRGFRVSGRTNASIHNHSEQIRPLVPIPTESEMSGSRTCTNVRRAFLVAELVTLTLFLVGPCAGSIDSNADGLPDVPIVVTAWGPIAQVSRTVPAPVSARAPDPSLAAAVAWNPHTAGTSRSARARSRFDLTLLSLLRC